LDGRILRSALDQLVEVSEALSIPEEIAIEAARICEEVLESGQVSMKPLARVPASALYAACRDAGFPVTMGQISSASGVAPKKLTKSYRQVVERLDLRVRVVEPAEYLPIVARRAGAGAGVQARALGILSRAEKAGAVGGMHPIGLTASALYMAAELEGERLTQKDAAAAAGVTEATVRNERLRLTKVLGTHG